MYTVTEAQALLPAGAVLLAFAPGAQGFATQAHGFVLYRHPHAVGDFKVHTVHFETQGLVSGGYHSNANDAWMDWFNRVELSAHYVLHGTPLSGEPQ